MTHDIEHQIKELIKLRDAISKKVDIPKSEIIVPELKDLGIKIVDSSSSKRE